MPDFLDHDRFDHAIDFSLGLLSDEEERALLEMARHDPEFERLLQRQCAVAARARAEHPSERKRRPRPRVGRRLTRRVGAAAALVAVLALFLLLRSPAPPGEYWIPVDIDWTTQRSANAISEEWRRAVESYAAHDLQTAIPALEKVRPEGAAASLRDLLLASSFFNARRPIEALEILRRIDLDSLPEPWHGYASELFSRVGQQVELDRDS